MLASKRAVRSLKASHLIVGFYKRSSLGEPNMNHHAKRLGRIYRQAAGFTLIELLVAVAIIGILSAIALPSYSKYITRGKIPEATSTLSLKAVKLEQFFQDNKTYQNAPDCNADITTSKYFTFQCSASSATTYRLVATGVGSMAGFSFTIDQSNAKATPTVPADWTSNNSCWVTNSGGTC